MNKNKNSLVLTDTTVKLVASVNNKRAALFEKLINSRAMYTLVGHINPYLSEDAYYHCFFDLDGFENKEQIIEKMAEVQESDGITIIDVSDKSLLLDEKVSPLLTVATVFSTHVTCSTQEIQEMIYDNTGRLATIVEWPVFKQDFSPPYVEKKKEEKDVHILWYGLNSEIFSVKPFMQSQEYKINTYFENKNQRNWRQWKTELNKADIIFLPKTFTEEDEDTRILKVEECVKLGKFVVAPGFNSTQSCLDCDLQDGIHLLLMNPSKVEKIILDNQKSIQRLYDPENSADQIMQALDFAPNDEFTQNIDYLLAKSIVEGSKKKIDASDFTCE